MLPRLLRALGAATLLGALGGCELLWSWDGIGNGGGASGGAGCTSATALVCDDFEHDDVNNPWRPNTSPGGTIAIDTVHAHSGAHALHATTDESVPGEQAFGNTLMAGWQQGLPGPPTTVYVRIYVFPSSSVAGFEGFGELVEPDETGYLASLWMGSSGYGWMQNVSPEFYKTPSPLPSNKWTCVEWELDEASATGRVWVDGQEVPGLTQSLPSFAMNLIEIGQRVSPNPDELAAGQTNDLWLDDVVVDVRRVGCQ
jgi:hypothetical protein